MKYYLALPKETIEISKATFDEIASKGFESITIDQNVDQQWMMININSFPSVR